MQKLYSSIDIGSNSVLLLIASHEGGKLVPKLEKIAEPRIGEGLSGSGIVSLRAKDRLENVLIDLRKTINKVGARTVSVAGTQALREAENAKEVIQLIQNLLGHPCRILTGEEEAEISLSAVKHQYPGMKIAVVDIGGASTEISSGAKRVSLPVGVVKVLENSGNLVEENRSYANNELKKLPKLLKKAKVIGIGGTFTTAIMMQKSLEEFNVSEIENACISREEMSRWITRLSELTSKEKSNLVGLPDSRKDIIIPGLCIAEAIMEKWEVGEIIVSTWGLRHGLILNHLYAEQ